MLYLQLQQEYIIIFQKKNILMLHYFIKNYAFFPRFQFIVLTNWHDECYLEISRQSYIT